MSPENEPKKPEDSLFIRGLKSRMKGEGITLEEAARVSREEIEKTKEYDSMYPEQIKMLEDAVEYLKSQGEK
jgi:hypothetical protein